MKKLLLTTAFILAANTAVAASSTVGDYPACISKDYFDQMVESLSVSDENAFNYLISNMKCIVTKPDIPVSILDGGFGWKHVRAYATNGVAVELWTNSENIK